MNLYFPKNALLLASSISLAACGGGGSDGGSGTDPVEIPLVDGQTQTGVLLDSPVGGMGYRTATRPGITAADGSYNYLPGEMVTFFVGDLAFPAVTATAVVTPVDIAAGNVTAQTNMLQLL